MVDLDHPDAIDLISSVTPRTRFADEMRAVLETGDAQAWAYTDAVMSGSGVNQVQGEAGKLVEFGDENWWDEFFVGFK